MSTAPRSDKASAPSRLFDLSGRVALVTGGTRGLGREMALAFARAGADVAVASRKPEACRAVADELRSLTGCRAAGYPCHVGRWDDIDVLVDRVYEEFGRVDVLVNNAGVSPLYPHPTELGEDLYDKVMAVNAKGPFRLTSLVGNRMAAGGGGSVVNVSSLGAAKASPAAIPYAAAKAALESMTRSFAVFFGPTVRVNAIRAGYFRTDVSKAWDEDAFARIAESFALRRAAQPAEVVGTALYLASDASSYTTGEILTVDGGAGL